ncbi:MAG: polyprenyl synthetase family protein [PVC group bacterium]
MKNRALGADLIRLDRELSLALRPPHSFLGRISRQALKNGGKKRRGRLIVILGRLFGVPRGSVIGTAVAVEIVHLATLIHDDVIDGARRRRSRPALQHVQGVAPALLYGDLLFSRGVSFVNRLGNRDLTDLLLETVHSLCSGEILENRLSRKFPWTERDYLQVASLKTASLFRYCCQAPGILAGLPQRRRRILERFGGRLGISCQIADDCLDFAPPREGAEKDRLADLKNGVPSLPLVLAGKNPALRKELRAAVGKGAGTLRLKRLAAMIRRGGFVGQALSRAREYLESTREDVAAIETWGDEGRARLLRGYLDAQSAFLDGLEGI